jgi:hypothetical protein
MLLRHLRSLILELEAGVVIVVYSSVWMPDYPPRAMDRHESMQLLDASGHTHRVLENISSQLHVRCNKCSAGCIAICPKVSVELIQTSSMDRHACNEMIEVGSRRRPYPNPSDWACPLAGASLYLRLIHDDVEPKLVRSTSEYSVRARNPGPPIENNY